VETLDSPDEIHVMDRAFETPALDFFTDEKFDTGSDPAGQDDYNNAVAAYKSGEIPTAFTLAGLAADEGHAEAQFMVGHILQNGQAGTIDYHGAEARFRSAALAGNTDAMMALGQMSVREQGGLQLSDAPGWFSMAANAGRGDGMRALGEMYIKGIAVAADLEKGRKWLQKAVDFGDTIAIRQLADSYFETDAGIALRWYKKAAARGDQESAYIAAIMHQEDFNIHQEDFNIHQEDFNIHPDAAEVARLMRIAAEAGYGAAQTDYGLLVYEGRGVTASIDEAAAWFEKAALNGDREGQFFYAFVLAKGEGVKRSYEDAYYWLLKSSKSGKSSMGAYDGDRQTLKERLEKNVDPAILQRAINRITAEGSP